MRILKIVNGNDGGGIFTCERQFIKHWTSKGISVDLIIVGQGKAIDAYKSIATKYKVFDALDAPYSGNLWTIITSIGKSRSFAKHLCKVLAFDDNYDAVIYRRPNFIHIAGFIGRALSCRTYWHLPSFVNRKLGLLYYIYYMRKYGITPVANSIYTQRTLGSTCRHVIYPGYDEDRTVKTTETFRKSLGIPSQTVVFGIAARITHSKAQDLVISAMYQTGLFKEGANLIIAGSLEEDDYVRHCKQLAKEYVSNVHFIGRIDNLAKFYSSIDVYVNSRRNEEPFGISIAEALGAGLPIIAYYLGGPSEMVKDRVNGWLVRAPTVDSFSDAFLACIKDRHKWPEMGLSSLHRANKYSSERNAQQFIELIRNTKRKKM